MAVFAIVLTTLLLAAALAVDGGVLFVEKRDQQNAADAAALAGARFLTSGTPGARLLAREAAAEVALANGFQDGTDDETVNIHIPPATGPHAGQAGYIEVRIASVRPSIFARVAGIFDLDVSARAVALNGEGAGGDFAILALDPRDCPAGKQALQVTGTGYVTAYGDIQVNSTCDTAALNVGGGGEVGIIDLINVGYACRVAGGLSGPPITAIDVSPNATINCEQVEGADQVADPLRGLCQPYYDPDPDPESGCPVDNSPPGLAEPPQQVTPGNPKSLLADEDIPDGCPGAAKKPPSWESPQKCVFKGNTYRDTAWVMSPGLYPGGLDLSDGTFYFKPGIYFVAGGGINIGGGGATARTLDASGNLVPANLDEPPNGDHGVMLFNTDHPDVAWGDIKLNGGSVDFQLLPLNYADSDPLSYYNGVIVFNDRDFPSDPDASSITLNGGSSNFEVRGTIYSPSGLVTVNGNSTAADFVMDQVIAYRYKLNGNEGSITALNDTDFLPQLRAAGLVE